MSVLKFIRTSRQKYLAIAVGYIAACVMLYLCGALYIQFMLLFAAFALFGAILVNEKSNLLGRVPNANPTADESWSKTKKELDKVRDNIDRTKSPEQQRTLQRQRLNLENELRRIEWKVKENDMTRMYNASRGNLRELPDLRKTAVENHTEVDRKYAIILDKLVNEAKKIIEKEPPASRQQALIPIANLARAQYNTLKKNSNDKENVRGDYFAVWATLSSYIAGVRIDTELSKYSSERFKKKFFAFQESLSASQTCTRPDEQSLGGIISEDDLSAISRPNEEGKDPLQ